MCGIAGVFTLTERPNVEDAAGVLRMLDAQAHRGPDDWGLLVPVALATRIASDGLVREPAHVRTYPAGPGPGAVLGSRRLAILDLSARGRMPMPDAAGRLWITHSGEVYNHTELRAELARGGAVFASTTDSEVVLQGYARWGADVVERLRGMFAFAIFEAAPQPRLLLARDAHGIKPLYVFRDAQRIVFASEVRALVASGLVPDEPDPVARVRYLEWGSVPAPLTTVARVATLPAGHCLTADRAGAAPRPYRDRARAAAGTPADHDASGIGRRTRALLEGAVRRQLASDVPLGVFLSGGIDSSGLVALARPHRARLTTLSIAFDEPRYDESRYARLVAERYRTDHREITVRSADFFRALPRYLSAMDQPTIDGVNAYFTAEAAKRAGVTVVLSGAAADELFLGYGHHRRVPALDRLRRWLAACPAGPRRAILDIAARGGPRLGWPGLSRIACLDSPAVVSTYRALRGLFAPAEVQALLGTSTAELAGCGAAPAAGVSDHDGAMATVETLDFERYLRDQLLRDLDVMAMAHSIEARVPYLDDDVVDYVRGLPIRDRLAGAGPKPLLRRALGDALPREVWARPKMGFTFPLGTWLRESAGELRALTLERGHLERRAVEAVWDGFMAGRAHWSRPWALAVLACFDMHRGDRPALAPVA